MQSHDPPSIQYRAGAIFLPFELSLGHQDHARVQGVKQILVISHLCTFFCPYVDFYVE